MDSHIHIELEQCLQTKGKTTYGCHILATLSQPPENTRVPSPLHPQHNTGPSCLSLAIPRYVSQTHAHLMRLNKAEETILTVLPRSPSSHISTSLPLLPTCDTTSQHHRTSKGYIAVLYCGYHVEAMKWLEFGLNLTCEIESDGESATAISPLIYVEWLLLYWLMLKSEQSKQYQQTI
jgi:hypothetical protein